MTLNQIIAKFRTQAESHKMVGKFQVGQEFDFAVEEVEYYPLVWLIPNDEDFQIIANSTADPFADSRTDVVAGYAIDLQVNTPYLESYCDIPT
jgi:hypothetical protein